jgi:hypothetical protein
VRDDLVAQVGVRAEQASGRVVKHVDFQRCGAQIEAGQRRHGRAIVRRQEVVRQRTPCVAQPAGRGDELFRHADQQPGFVLGIFIAAVVRQAFEPVVRKGRRQSVGVRRRKECVDDGPSVWLGFETPL